MDNQDFIELFSPSFIIVNFEFVSYDSSTSDINIYLDEKPIQQADGVYISKGFCPASKIQDFPLRGECVYLHVRRRKWLNIQTKHIHTRQYDLTHKGTDLTHDFVAFSKATN